MESLVCAVDDDKVKLDPCLLWVPTPKLLEQYQEIVSILEGSRVNKPLVFLTYFLLSSLYFLIKQHQPILFIRSKRLKVVVKQCLDCVTLTLNLRKGVIPHFFLASIKEINSFPIRMSYRSLEREFQMQLNVSLVSRENYMGMKTMKL